MRYGLIGFPLGHSFSRSFFTEKFQRERLQGVEYDNFPLASIEEVLPMIGANPDLQGFNITIPYKQAIFPLLDEVAPQARAIGAVNCVRIFRSGGGVILKGFNTDAYGFHRSLATMLGSIRPQALVLGTGGASKAVCYVLRELGIEYRLVSRSGGGEILSYADLTPAQVAASRLIVNTTPLGTFPRIDTLPELPYEAISRGHFLHDLVYNPAETAFLHEGRLRGATVKNGYDMLLGQAERSWEIWNDEL